MRKAEDEADDEDGEPEATTEGPRATAIDPAARIP
jgi:hypothetical protein